jgi:penicillin-binding protein 2
MKRRRKLGKAFADTLIQTNSSSGLFRKHRDAESWQDMLLPNYDDHKSSEPPSIWRIITIACFCIIIFAGLSLRLFQLQVVHGEENRDLANSNRVQIRIIHAPRGVIYDRNGKVLAQNDPGFRLKQTLPDGTIKYRFVTRDEALVLEAKNDPQYYNLEVDAIRSYPLGPVTSHILGYLGEINEDELKQPQFGDYRLGDRIGKSGVEQVYENYLRGKDGAEIIEVDAEGKKLRSLRVIYPQPGQNVYVSIDADLQKVAYDTLKKQVEKTGACCGVVVGEQPQTGQVLVMVSYPSYDNNAFNDPKREAEVTHYFTDNQAPLLNRVIGGTYPPGSTFKIATALAGLSSKKITPDTIIEDTGIMYLGPYSFANWYFTQYGKKEGPVDLKKALARSNDIYFYQLGDRIGQDLIGDIAKRLGMGKKIGIDLPGEVDGLIPNNDWKVDNIGTVWYPGDTLHMAIGQGYLLTTPLQILAQTTFIANDGKLIQPHLGYKITRADGSLVREFVYKPIVENSFDPADIAEVKAGLSQVPKIGGTAWPFFQFSIPTAGKTGTAEFGDPKGNTHAWYTSYAPEINPEIVLTIMLEAAGEGSSEAAPVAKDIYTWYFNPDKSHIKSLDTIPIPVATESARTLGE